MNAALNIACALFLATTALAGSDTPGDECFNALPAVVGANGPMNTASMTPSADPPANGPCAYLNWANSRDAWWVFEAPLPGTLTAELCGSNFDTSMVIYQGPCGALTRLACDDDSCAPSGPLYQSKIANLAVAAGPVYIRVGGYGGAVGSAALDLRFKPSGANVGWGNNGSGQLQPLASIGGVTALASYGNHTVAIKADGSVACWGLNDSGQCNVPPTLGTVSAIACGLYHTVAIRANGMVSCWGGNASGQSSVPPTLGTAKAVAAGANHTIAIRTDGTVVCWGYNVDGQCNVPPTLGTARSVAGANAGSVAARTDGTVMAWGFAPAPPAGLASVISVAAGGGSFGFPGHAVALTAGGGVVCWGVNSSGESTVPTDLGTATAIAAGSTHTVALLANGSVRCWGSNYYGQCSVPVGLPEPYAAIAAGFGHTVALSTRDCNANRVVDLLEVESFDCNASGTHDCWEAVYGLIEDCNGNGLGDSCEKSLQVVANSGQLGPIGAAHNQVYTVAGAAPALEPGRVVVRVRGRGDFSGGLEYLRVRIGTALDVQALGGTVDCGTGTPTETFTMSATDFNAAIEADGAVRVRLEPSIAVDWNLCPSGTWAEVELDYLGARPSDCNVNGLLDTCELADALSPDTNHNGIIDSCEAPLAPCLGDLNGDSAVNGADLGILLGLWGPVSPGAAADLNGDGAVSGADLGMLLGAWGLCGE